MFYWEQEIGEEETVHAKDYQMIAGVLLEARVRADHDISEAVAAARYKTIDHIEQRLSELLQQENPRFNPGRFHSAACWGALPYTEEAIESPKEKT